MEKMALIALARQKAQKYGLDGDTFCALIEQESGWNTNAIRYEPGFLKAYVSPILLRGEISQTEAYSRSFSWGLGQVMGQVARENGFKGKYLSELCDPEVGLEQSAVHFSKILNRVAENYDVALLHYNGGGNPDYPDEVKARIPTYNS